ncbi:Clp protease ClpP [Paenibacillus larvae]|uniref:head maturation protease, ClpP-related n=1 Tax=Paenibacillus larvae TaxID=1464 RepID=UPI000248193C|nr:head maturation protease, ClpP-related [Paenibacillus larvae]ETK29818.1 prophage Clp protease-like protein [Paenibacillus larvae subsp. larvae DSM 25719]MCY9710046.1 Clp protease ClpP [Paenibacillus larvae]MCY9718954.1 Clp protease ClpP [Paenibacillus larvae]
MSKPMKFWTMAKNEAKNSAEIAIYGAIGTSWWEESVSANQFYKDLKALGDLEEITVRINSAGGSVFDGLAIRSQLKNHKAFVTVHVDGWAASIASIIAMAGDKIVMAKGSMMMIHNPTNSLWGGDAQDFRDMADFLDKIRDSLVSVYEDRTANSKEELIKLIDAETWMSAEEAVEMGFADEVEEGTAVTATMNGAVAMVNGVSMDFSRFTNPPMIPKALSMQQLKNETTTLPENKTKEDEELNLSELKNKYPDLYKEILNEGITQERNRIKELDELIAPGNESIISEAKSSGASAAETAVNIIKAENERRKKFVNQLNQDADDSGVNDVEADNTEAVSSSEINKERESKESENAAAGLVNVFKRIRGGRA